jgi:hypothetical protein
VVAGIGDAELDEKRQLDRQAPRTLAVVGSRRAGALAAALAGARRGGRSVALPFLPTRSCVSPSRLRSVACANAGARLRSRWPAIATRPSSIAQVARDVARRVRRDEGEHRLSLDRDAADPDRARLAVRGTVLRQHDRLEAAVGERGAHRGDERVDRRRARHGGRGSGGR